MQIPTTFSEQVFVCFMSGFVTAGAFMLAVLGGKVWRHTWAWIDDSEEGRNPILESLAKLRGWTQYTTEGSSKYLWWKDKKGETQADVLLPFAFADFFAPLAVFLSIRLYPVLLTVLTLLVIAYVARFARRHKKLFDKHLKDPEAHK